MVPFVPPRAHAMPAPDSTTTRDVPGDAPPPRLAWLLVPACALAWVAGVGHLLWDASELTAAAFALGGSHPPGQPTHALLGRLAALVPLGTITYRLSLLSVVTEVGAAGLVAWLTWALTRRRHGTWLDRFAPHAAALCCLLAPPFLREASRPECYGLATLLSVASVCALVRWLEGSAAHLRVAALAAGLAAATHAPEALVPLVIGALAVLTVRRDALRPRPIAWAALACVLGLTTFIYLPVRAWAGAAMWGSPGTWHGFVRYVTAAMYLGGDAPVGEPFVRGTRTGLLELFVGAGIVPVVGALFALGAGRRWTPRGRHLVALFLVTAIGLSAAMLILPLYPSINLPDKAAYFAPQVGLLAAVGAAGLAAPVPERDRLAWLGAPLLLILALNVPNLTLAPDRAKSDIAALDALGESILDSPPPRALVLVGNEFPIMTLAARQTLEGARPDLAVMATTLVTAPWAWRALASHPLYDGRMKIGPGPGPRERLLNGLISPAQGKVAIAFGESPTFLPKARIDGIYVIVPPSDDGPSPPPSFGERAMPLIASMGERYPLGDSDDAGDEIRRNIVRRAEEHLSRGDLAEATRELRRALWFLPRSLLDRVDLSAPIGRAQVRPIRTPLTRARMLTRADAVRVAMVWLDARGRDGVVRALLQRQLDAGDPRALLQLALFAERDGHPDRAVEAVRAFRDEAPELADEVPESLRKLRAARASGPSTSP